MSDVGLVEGAEGGGVEPGGEHGVDEGMGGRGDALGGADGEGLQSGDPELGDGGLPFAAVGGVGLGEQVGEGGDGVGVTLFGEVEELLQVVVAGGVAGRFWHGC